MVYFRYIIVNTAQKDDDNDDDDDDNNNNNNNNNFDTDFNTMLSAYTSAIVNLTLYTLYDIASNSDIAPVFFTAICGGILRVGGPGSVVGIATGYGLDGPGIESRWGQGFQHLSRPALGPTSCSMGTGSFPE